MAAEEPGMYARRQMTHVKYNADLTIDESQCWTVEKGEYVPAGHPARRMHPEAIHWSGSQDEALKTDVA